MLPLITLFMVVVQVGLALHTRNLLVAAAQDGARFAANADRTAQEGEQRTRQAIRASLGEQVAEAMTVTALPVQGEPAAVGVRVSGPLPWVLGLVDPVTITVEGHALEERPG
jgi:Flp pilus assembly protein TadG